MEFKTIHELAMFLNKDIQVRNTKLSAINVMTTEKAAEEIIMTMEQPPVVIPPVTDDPKAPSTPSSVEASEPTKMKITLSPSQQAEVDKILRWFKGVKGFGIHQLAGFAGTGKSTIMLILLTLLGLRPHDVRLCAPTGTAALVFREKTPGHDAVTIHRLIYKWEEEYGKQVRKTIDERIQGAKLVICDESSMVTREEGTNLMAMCKKAGAKLLVIGDPGQLPPVDPEAEKRGERPDFFLLNPDGFLTQVMRQAAENPIIQLSMDIRTATDNGVAYMFPTHIEKIGRNVFLRTKTQIQLPTLAKVIQGGGAIIAGTNKTRRGFNHALRAFLGFNQPTLMEGEKVLIKENCEGGEVTNGMRGTVTNVHMMSDGLIYFDFTPDAFPGIHRLSVHPDILFERKTKKQMSWENIERKKKGLKPIELGVEVFFGYVITAHASQGGQWKNVYVIDEGWVFNRGGDPEGFAKQNRWTYTAVTRASENLVIYRGGKLDIPSEQFARELAARLNAQS